MGLRRRWGILRRWGVLRSFGSEERRTSPIFRLLGPKIEEPPTFHFFGSNNEKTHLLLLPNPTPSTAGHQLLSAIRRSGSSDPSPSLQIHPKIETPRGRRGSSTQSSAPTIEDGGFFDLRGRRSKMARGCSKVGGFFEDGMGFFEEPSFFEEPLIFEELPHLRRTLPSSFFGPENRKNPSFSISEAEDRRTPSLQSSIFGPEDRRTPHLRSSAPKNGSKVGLKNKGEGVGLLRRGGGCWGSSKGGFFDLSGPKNEELPPSSAFSARRSKNSPILHSLPEERRTPHLLLLPTPTPSTNGHQLLPAIRRFGSSDRSSTLQSGPKTEIGPLLDRDRLSIPSIFGLEEWSEDRTKDGGWRVRFLRRLGFWFEDGVFFDLSGSKNEEPPSSTFSARRTKKSLIFHFLEQKNAEPLPPPYSSSDLPPSTNGHAHLSAILSSGSSA